MSNENKIPKMQVIKTDKCWFVKWEDHQYGVPYIKGLLFDGNEPIATHDASWYKVPADFSTVEKKVPSTKENYRMVLQAEKLEATGFSGTTLGGLKPEIARTDCMIDSDYDGWQWKDEYKHLSSLYELVFDTVEHPNEPVEYELELYCEIPSLGEYSGMKYEVYGKWENTDPHQFITDRHIGRRAIDKIIYPSVLHKTCHATMPSERLYKIIRFHVKQNIDYRYADITSDYEFCFTIKKRILSGNMYDSIKDDKKNYKKIKLDCDNKEVFEMTHKGSNYKNYTVLPSIGAKNDKALKRKIDKYLKDLIEYINAPVIVCQHCNGTGVEHKIEKFAHL